MSADTSPSPWSIDPVRESDDVLIEDSRGRTVAYVGSFLHDRADPLTPAQIKANATLLRSAPDLLSLAHEFAESCAECSGARCDDCADIWEAIDLAEGRS